MPNDFISPAATAATLGISEKTLNRWRQTGKGPDYVCSAEGWVRYRKEEVERWRASQVTSVSVRYLSLEGAAA